MRFFILLLPWLELFTLIELGVKTSALTALLYVFVTLLLGLSILQWQGKGIVEHLRRAREGATVVPELLRDDMAMGFAGLLLMIPGMITDLVALLVMAGPLRRRLANVVQGSKPDTYSTGRVARERAAEPEVIEGDYRRIDDQ